MSKKEPKFLDLKVDCAVDVVDATSLPKDVSKSVAASVELTKPSGIVTEKFPRVGDGVTMIRTYSKNGKYIIQDGTGVKYIEAVDPEFCGRTYTESDEDVPIEDLAPETIEGEVIEAEYTDVGGDN